MKVFIGPYKTWIGPYQLAKPLKYLGIDSDKVGKWLDKETFVGPLCNWIDRKKKRKIRVKINRWDSWSADHTLSLVILPILKQLRDTKRGGPGTDDADVPEELRRSSAPPVENEWDTDDNWFKRWDWILNEMIFAFEQLSAEDWEAQFHWVNGDYKKGKIPFNADAYRAHAARIDNGTTLFGKYYRCLWD